jgi:hypothetical protein
MTANILNLRYFFFLLLSTVCIAQGLDVSIGTDKTVYQRNDSIYFTVIFKNVSSLRIKFLNRGIFEVNDHCFHIYRAGNEYFYYLNKTKPEDFITLEPGAEYVSADYYHVYWPCRSMPPVGNWNLKINFVLNITPTENKYYVREGEEIIDTIQVEDAWTGIASSLNPVSIIIKRPE